MSLRQNSHHSGVTRHSLGHSRWRAGDHAPGRPRGVLALSSFPRACCCRAESGYSAGRLLNYAGRASRACGWLSHPTSRARSWLVLCPHPPQSSSPEAGVACELSHHRGVSVGWTWYPSRLFGHSARRHVLSWGRA